MNTKLNNRRCMQLSIIIFICCTYLSVINNLCFASFLFWFIVNILCNIASCAEVIHFNEHKVTPLFTISESKSGNVKTQKVFSHTCPYIT